MVLQVLFFLRANFFGFSYRSGANYKYSMPRFLSIFLALVLVSLSLPALAAYSCSLSSSGFSATYAASGASSVTGTGAVTINCTRAAADSTTMFYELASDQGLYVQNSGIVGPRAQLAADTTARLTYSLNRDAANTQIWGPRRSERFTGSLSFGSALTATATVTYWYLIPSAQLPREGTYTDTETASIYVGTAANNISVNALASASFPVSILVPSACAISTTPGSINFSYSSFQTTAAVASTSFAVTCATGTVYTMSLDASNGVINDIAYSLSISPAGTQTGTGTAQTASIRGTIAANQAGTCTSSGCTGQQVRTLIITY